ncbi:MULTISPECIES: hypothetical protein [unclassified Streptomyces]|uniref:hypothetical protein n=1 Tax=unclassified Streptomyces TaxID=2593676 RepID=UPI003657AF45
MTRAKKILTTIALILTAAAASASPALADNSMPAPAPDSPASVTSPAGSAP